MINKQILLELMLENPGMEISSLQLSILKYSTHIFILVTKVGRSAAGRGAVGRHIRLGLAMLPDQR